MAGNYFKQVFKSAIKVMEFVCQAFQIRRALYSPLFTFTYGGVYLLNFFYLSAHLSSQEIEFNFFHFAPPPTHHPQPNFFNFTIYSKDLEILTKNVTRPTLQKTGIGKG